VVGKSPLTGGWGDANSGGDFAPFLKFAGFDAVFFSGVSAKPVYLLVKEGKAELRDAAGVWGRDTCETEDVITREHGPDTRVACIGPSGEQQSLIAAIITKRGSAAARSGLGAVMGSKRLKAVAACGRGEISVADPEKANQLRKDYVNVLKTTKFYSGGKTHMDLFHKFGTTGMTQLMIEIGSAPFKNWGGSLEDMPDWKGLTAEAAISNQLKSEACWRCPVACKGVLKAGTPEYPYVEGSRRPEYETQTSFGSLCLNNHTDSINFVNDICNRYGLDTISAGTVVAFAIECYQAGIISKEQTGGLELKWGDHPVIVKLTGMICRREGLGAILADGVKKAAERLGKASEPFAVHVGGQELGMHDPKLVSSYVSFPLGARYQMDATPGRHTQGFGPSGLTGHVLNIANICQQVGMMTLPGHEGYLTGFLNAVTGTDRSWEDYQQCGERAMTVRHAFNLREGINPLKRPLHDRILGKPPIKNGPMANVVLNIDRENYWNMGALDWDPVTTRPSRKKLLALGLPDIADDLWKAKPPEKA
jgi:aldehyde:ferredoxin oxidoreductase